MCEIPVPGYPKNNKEKKLTFGAGEIKSLHLTHGATTPVL